MRTRRGCLTERAQLAIKHACQITADVDRQQCLRELALTLLEARGVAFAAAVRKLGLTAERLRRALGYQDHQRQFAKEGSFTTRLFRAWFSSRRLSKEGEREIDLPLAVEEVLGQAKLEARSLRHSFVGTEHIMLALLREPVIADSLRKEGIDYSHYRQTIQSMMERRKGEKSNS